jgi:hypothetical protein
VTVEDTNGSNKEEAFSYDKEKYRETILDAAETVLGYFGFDRTVYGNKKNTGSRKWRWLQEPGQERENDIKAEKVVQNSTIRNKKYETVINKGILLSSSF